MLGLTRAFGGLYLASLLMQLGSTLLMTYLALRLTADGVAESWGGALMAANALGMVAGGKVGYALIKQVGHVRTYVICAGVICVAVLSHAFADALYLWLLLRAIVGLAMMCQLMVLESWLNACAPGEQRGRVLGLYMVAAYVGMMLGQLVLSWESNLSTQALLGVAMAFALSQVPLALVNGTNLEALPPARVSVLVFCRRVPQALTTVLVSGMINGCFYGLAAIYASRKGLSTAEVGQFMALAIGAGLLAQLPLGWLSDRMSRSGLIRALALALLLACLPLGYDQAPSFSNMLIFAGVIGALQFCLYPLGVNLANRNMEPELRVSMAGLLLVTFGVGACIGPLMAGAIMEHWGVSSLYYFLAFCAGMLLVAMRHGRDESEPLLRPGHEPQL